MLIWTVGYILGYMSYWSGICSSHYKYMNVWESYYLGYIYIHTRGPGALTFVNSIAKNQL